LKVEIAGNLFIKLVRRAVPGKEFHKTVEELEKDEQGNRRLFFILMFQVDQACLSKKC
jgi:hypothetical protein